MDDIDVLVVGGGPAGSSLAWGLRGSGLDVVVLDRARFPRDKVCAGWITPPVVEAVALDLADYAKQRVLQPVRGFAVSMRGHRAARVDHGRVVSYGIRRCELDHYLLSRTGAVLALGQGLRELRCENGRWLVDERWRARWLVGAGGHFCPVARHLGARPGETEPMTIVAREVEFELESAAQDATSVLPEIPALFFEPDLRGYGWVVRKGDWLNVGLGRQDSDGFPLHAERFLAWLRDEGYVPPETPARWKGHAYLLHDQSPRPLAGPGWLLVGDSAGLAYPRSGEGIRPAVESALLAARVLAGSSGMDPADVAERYARAVVARFGPRHGRMRNGPSSLLPARWRAPIVARLLASPTFARRVVVDRWFLHRKRPALPPDPRRP